VLIIDPVAEGSFDLQIVLQRLLDADIVYKSDHSKGRD
jgi:hypothetical protein